jgi:hypothetical protein
MGIEWNRVTWYSKLAAVVVFLATFVIAFNLGMMYEQVRINAALVESAGTTEATSTTTKIQISESTGTPETAASTTDIQIGGGAGAHCGGFIQNAPTCAKGFHCQLKVSSPDTGGTCVAD